MSRGSIMEHNWRTVQSNCVEYQLCVLSTGSLVPPCSSYLLSSTTQASTSVLLVTLLEVPPIQCLYPSRLQQVCLSYIRDQKLNSYFLSPLHLSFLFCLQVLPSFLCTLLQWWRSMALSSLSTAWQVESLIQPSLGWRTSPLSISPSLTTLLWRLMVLWSLWRLILRILGFTRAWLTMDWASIKSVCQWRSFQRSPSTKQVCSCN